MFYAFAPAGRGDSNTWTPGVPLRSAPGCVLVAPVGRIHSRHIRTTSGG